MVFALNPTSAESAGAFQAKAIGQPSSSTSTGISTGAKVGIAIGSIAGVGCLLLIALLFLRKRRQALADAENAKGSSGYQKSLDGHSPTILSSQQNMYYRSGLTPINTKSTPAQALSQSVYPEAPNPPPKGEELHGISSPSEMATAYNQDAAVELQGSEGRQYAQSLQKVDDHDQSDSLLAGHRPNHIQEMLSPQSGGNQEDYAQKPWKEQSIGTVSSRANGSPLISPESGASPRYESEPYDSRRL
jgi:hypothetical protein